MGRSFNKQEGVSSVPATNFQAGILDPPPEHILVAALAFAAADSPSCHTAFRNLRELIRRELAADIDEIDPVSWAWRPAMTRRG